MRQPSRPTTKMTYVLLACQAPSHTRSRLRRLRAPSSSSSPGPVLHKADLSGADLGWADLRKANLDLVEVPPDGRYETPSACRCRPASDK
jgi:Pentapeptide repeats (8 copies)